MKLILKATLFQQLWERQNRNRFTKLQTHFHFSKQLTNYLFEKTTSHNHLLTIINASQQRDELPQTFSSVTKYVQEASSLPTCCSSLSYVNKNHFWTTPETGSLK